MSSAQWCVQLLLFPSTQMDLKTQKSLGSRLRRNSSGMAQLKQQLHSTDADILCAQEIKLDASDIADFSYY